MIILAADPQQFKALVLLNASIKEKTKQQLLTKVDELISKGKPINIKQFQLSLISNNQAPNIYSGYRKLNLNKLAVAVNYFANQLQPWKTQLNKLLFYADFLMFKKSCFSISGIQYRAIQMGPVPNNYNLFYDYLAGQNKFEIKTTVFDSGAIGEQFLSSNKETNLSILEEEEQLVLKTVAQKFKNFKTKDLIEYSHKEKAWLENYEEKQLIDYKYAFDIEL